MISSDFGLNNFFTKNGKDIWKLNHYCLTPTCELENLETGEKESFGMDGLTAGSFLKITMPEQSPEQKERVL